MMNHRPIAHARVAFRAMRALALQVFNECPADRAANVAAENEGSRRQDIRERRSNVWTSGTSRRARRLLIREMAATMDHPAFRCYEGRRIGGGAIGQGFPASQCAKPIMRSGSKIGR